MLDRKTLEPEIKPCPFCGGESSKATVTYRGGTPSMWWEDGSEVTKAHYINCTSCGSNNSGIVGGHKTPEKAMEHWNKRSTSES